MNSSAPRVILLADDDAEDCLLLGEALREIGRDVDLRTVRDGEELLDYLHRRGRYAPPADAPTPDVILMDLKMPRLDGREAIRALKGHPRWRRTPIVALTTSTAQDDIAACYDLGVNSYIPKPVTYRALVEIVKVMSRYWFDVVELPPRG